MTTAAGLVGLVFGWVLWDLVRGWREMQALDVKVKRAYDEYVAAMQADIEAQEQLVASYEKASRRMQ